MEILAEKLRKLQIVCLLTKKSHNVIIFCGISMELKAIPEIISRRKWVVIQGEVANARTSRLKSAPKEISITKAKSTQTSPEGPIDTKSEGLQPFPFDTLAESPRKPKDKVALLSQAWLIELPRRPQKIREEHGLFFVRVLPTLLYVLPLVGRTLNCYSL